MVKLPERLHRVTPSGAGLSLKAVPSPAASLREGPRNDRTPYLPAARLKAPAQGEQDRGNGRWPLGHQG